MPLWQVNACNHGLDILNALVGLTAVVRYIRIWLECLLIPSDRFLF